MHKVFEGLINLHNHSTFSDGANDIIEIIEDAILNNLNVVAITDHYELILEFDNYLNRLLDAKKAFIGIIEVIIGVELEVVTLKNLDESQIDELNKVDVVLIENIEYQENLDKTLNQIQEMIHSLKPIIGVAHMDLERILDFHGKEVLNNVLQYFEKESIFFEFSTDIDNEFHSDLLFLSSDKSKDILEVLLEYDIKISIGSDSHNIQDLNNKRLIQANIITDKLKRVTSPNTTSEQRSTGE